MGIPHGYRGSLGEYASLVAITVVTAVTLILTAFRVLHGYHTVAQVTVGYVFGTVLGWWWHETAVADVAYLNDVVLGGDLRLLKCVVLCCVAMSALAVRWLPSYASRVKDS